MKRALFAGALLALSTTAAFAQTATTAPVIDGVVSIPWGDWFYNGATTIIAILGAILAWGIRHLPSRFVAIAQTAQVEQLLNKAIDYAINRTAGAVKGRALTLNVANQVLETAIEYAVTYAPAWLIGWVGGQQGLRDKIIARLDVGKDVALK